MRVGDAVLVVQPPQQVPQVVHYRLGHLGAVGVERVHAEGRLVAVREAEDRHAQLVAVSEAHGAEVVAAQLDGVGPAGGSRVAVWPCWLLVGVRPRGACRRVFDLRTVDELPVKAQVKADTIVA